MVRATPAPRAVYPKLLFVPYGYAVLLAVMAVVQLMGMGGFDLANITYATPGLPAMVVVIAALEIFALPFLLRFSLSPMARFFSALFCVAAPLFVWGNMWYVAWQNLTAPAWYQMVGSVVLVVLGGASFIILSGQKALAFGRGSMR